MEFAVMAVVLLSLLLGAIEIGRHMFTLEALRTATAEAVRVVTLRGSANMIARVAPCTGLSGDLAGVGLRAPFLNPGTLSMTMSGCATNAGITTVTVTVSHPFEFTVPLFGTPSLTLVETAQAVFN
ncbi:pilus assembly protein [Siccirubricoccus sp. KC 17139]|uniref:Pilus assembly protein n=1 Tax=Siccirubricoccus soli TaxID=2899147 RepID=A0ABT1DBD1_9PROT|nr:pilus assembly protein [Siccirubricoccus soli]MCP2685371.1 pilus assembly protein [Siccirubricoccus soli]